MRPCASTRNLPPCCIFGASQKQRSAIMGPPTWRQRCKSIRSRRPISPAMTLGNKVQRVIDATHIVVRDIECDGGAMRRLSEAARGVRDCLEKRLKHPRAMARARSRGRACAAARPALCPCGQSQAKVKAPSQRGTPLRVYLLRSPQGGMKSALPGVNGLCRSSLPDALIVRVRPSSGSRCEEIYQSTTNQVAKDLQCAFRYLFQSKRESAARSNTKN
jgi:hypothetical protein